MLAKLTVNEFKEESDGTRIYSVEAVEMEKPATFKASSISEDRRNYNRVAGFEEKLQRRIEEVKSESGSFSIGPAQVAGIMSGNALARITDPRRRTQVMSRIARDFDARNYERHRNYERQK